MREYLTYGLMWQGVETSPGARRHSLTLRAVAPYVCVIMSLRRAAHLER
jgi:hypothetical protein